MSQKGKWSVDVAERVLDATQFRTGRVLPDDVAVGVRDQAGADQRRTVVDGADVGGDVEDVLQRVEFVVRRLRVTEDARVRRDGGGADGSDAGERAAFDGYVERVRDGPDRLAREVRVDVRATVVGEHDVPGGVDAPRQFRHLDVDGVLDAVALAVGDATADEQAVLVADRQR